MAFFAAPDRKFRSSPEFVSVGRGKLKCDINIFETGFYLNSARGCRGINQKVFSIEIQQHVGVIEHHAMVHFSRVSTGKAPE